MFLEVDMDHYAHIRNNHYKLDWLMGNVDCHWVVPAVKPDGEPLANQLNSGVEVVAKLPAPST